MIHSCCDYLCPAYPVAFVHLALLHLSCMLWMWGGGDDNGGVLGWGGQRRHCSVHISDSHKCEGDAAHSSNELSCLPVVDCDYLFGEMASIDIHDDNALQSGGICCLLSGKWNGGEDREEQEKYYHRVFGLFLSSFAWMEAAARLENFIKIAIISPLLKCAQVFIFSFFSFYLSFFLCSSLLLLPRLCVALGVFEHSFRSGKLRRVHIYFV